MDTTTPGHAEIAAPGLYHLQLAITQPDGRVAWVTPGGGVMHAETGIHIGWTAGHTPVYLKSDDEAWLYGMAAMFTRMGDAVHRDHADRISLGGAA